jgi:hypothetical protein
MPKARGPDLIGVLPTSAEGLARGWDIHVKKGRVQEVTKTIRKGVSNQLTEGEVKRVLVK